MSLSGLDKAIIKAKRNTALKPSVIADSGESALPVSGVPLYRGIITCIRCNKLVPDTPYCIYCGKPTNTINEAKLRTEEK